MHWLVSVCGDGFVEACCMVRRVWRWWADWRHVVAMWGAMEGGRAALFGVGNVAVSFGWNMVKISSHSLQNTAENKLNMVYNRSEVSMIYAFCVSIYTSRFVMQRDLKHTFY